MPRTFVIAMLVAAASLATLGDASGAPRGRLRLLARGYYPGSPVAFGAPTYPQNYGTRDRAPSVNELYPKYYGSFHYRHLDNIGIPHGDIGFRGNGIYMSPW